MLPALYVVLPAGRTDEPTARCRIVVVQSAGWYSPGDRGWILDDGRRAGTIAFWNTAIGDGFIQVSSLYVFPDLRGRGIAGRLLRVARDAACDRELRGLWVPTHWSWQPAIRFYLDRGMWVRSWKHSLVLIETRDLPSWRLDVEGDRALFIISAEGGEKVLIRATRRGDFLEWVEEPGLDADWEIHSLATGTLALALAIRGWPLVRSEEQWAKRWNWSDFGQPEGLAAKIEVFEAVDRRDGFEVRTPRIARIPYRALDEIE